MGLFRKEPRSTPTAAPASQPQFSHAAFDPADVEDARRGHPAVSLQPFAAANGLGYTNNELFGAFVSHQPRWPHYTFNICRGAFPGGRLGQLSHDLFEMETSEGSIRAGGTFYDVRVTTRRSAREMLNLGGGDPENAPFAGNAAWIPSTAISLRTPEVNQLPELTIRNNDGSTLFGGGGLDRHGLAGFRLDRGPKDDDGLLSAIAGVCRPALTSRRDAYTRLRVSHGTVTLTVNGYRSGDDDLRQLTSVAVHVADGLVALTQPAPATPFATKGPAPTALRVPDGVPKPHPSFTPAYRSVATNLGLHQEEPYHLSQILPRCPIPGVASGVLSGTLLDTTTFGRMVWFEHGGRFSSSVRGGVIVPAASGATTPLGGVYHEPTGMQVEVVDGIAYCWKHELFTGRLESALLTPHAQAALAATGASTI